jgi:hypothetical protein
VLSRPSSPAPAVYVAHRSVIDNDEIARRLVLARDRGSPNTRAARGNRSFVGSTRRRKDNRTCTATTGYAGYTECVLPRKSSRSTEACQRAPRFITPAHLIPLVPVRARRSPSEPIFQHHSPVTVGSGPSIRKRLLSHVRVQLSWSACGVARSGPHSMTLLVSRLRYRDASISPRATRSSFTIGRSGVKNGEGRYSSQHHVSVRCERTWFTRSRSADLWIHLQPSLLH